MLSSALLPKAKHQIPLWLKDTVKLLRQSADTENLNLGKVVHAHLIVSDQSSQYHIFENNSLVNLYCKCGHLATARQLFDKMLKRNVVSWSALMAGYFQNGLALEALKIFKLMVSMDSLLPNEYIYALLVLSCCSDCGSLNEGRQCHGYVLKSGLLFHQYVKNALIRMYSTCSDVSGAMEVLNGVPGSDIFTYNSILNGLLDHGCLREALSVLERVVSEHMIWNKATCVTIFGICARCKDLNLGKNVHGQLVKSGVEFDLFVTSAIIAGNVQTSQSARNFFEELLTRNVVSWTSTLASYMQNGFYEEALKLFIEMQQEAISANEYTFAVLLNACAGLSSLGYGNSLHANVEKSVRI